MGSVEVVTVSSRVPTESYYRYETCLKSLNRIGVIPTVLGMDEPWFGLVTKLWRVRDWLRRGRNRSECILMVDSWDVIFARRPDEIAAECERLFPGRIVYNAEKACWPDVELIGRFPECGSAWRFPNTGVMYARANDFRLLLESLDLEGVGIDYQREGGTWHHKDDARCVYAAYLSGVVPWAWDTGCEVFQSFSDCKMEEFELVEGGVKNRATGTVPGILHFNGGAKNDIMPKVMEHLGL
jgi:hypothetical protein